jgi:hypothetical protein
MKDAQKPDHISLNTLINRLREGRFVIPDFQREFEWKPWDIQSLMRSIFLDYYIGSLLLWRGKRENFEALSCENIYGYNGSDNSEYIVLDGQQRLTAIYYSFIAPDVSLPSRKDRCFYFVKVDKFMNEEYDEAFSYEWLTKRWSKVMRDRSIQFEEHIFPLSIIGSGGWELPNWVQDYEHYWRAKATEAELSGNESIQVSASQHAENARNFGEHLKGITEQYQISYIELDRDLAVDKVCDIFTQINSRGIRLDVFDLINALLKPKGLQLKYMWREVATRLEFVETEKMNVYILQVMSILKQAYCSPRYLYFLLPGQPKPIRDSDGTRHRDILVPTIANFELLWSEAVDTLEKAIKLLQHPHEFGVTSSKYLPYVSILPVFASLQAYVKKLPPNKQLDAQRKVRYWYWASVFTNRYSGSVESTSARDFLDVKDWLANDGAEPALILEFKTRFRNLDFKKETKRGASVYNGIFNLLVLQGARDWMTGNIPQLGEVDDHHIVPLSWGIKHLHNSLINTILNRTPLTAATNRNVIKDRPPNEYLPELIKANGEKAIRSVLESHFISAKAQDILMRDPFTPEDFEAFIAERQRTIQDAIENLLIKERLDLPPHLRDLDEKIEHVELHLRQLIWTLLDNDSTLLPSHIVQKVNERIEDAAKKNPALDIEQYQPLSGKLEYFDLRDLQDTITNKTLWDRFERSFSTKEILNTKFHQLAELRNCIRHSRAVDEITRKEGEAALLWFEEVLKSNLNLPLS